MKKSLVEIIKANKGAIAKKALVVGGTVAGLLLVGMLMSEDNETDDGLADDTVEEINCYSEEVTESNDEQ